MIGAIVWIVKPSALGMARVLTNNPLCRPLVPNEEYKITNQVRMFESDLESIRKRQEELNK